MCEVPWGFGGEGEVKGDFVWIGIGLFVGGSGSFSVGIEGIRLGGELSPQMPL